jgi:hypothetical protein
MLAKVKPEHGECIEIETSKHVEVDLSRLNLVLDLL